MKNTVTAPANQASQNAARFELFAALQSPDGWPWMDGPYWSLIEYENRARTISMVNTAVPALFRDAVLSERAMQQDGVPEARLEQILALNAARQRMLYARLATASPPDTEFILSTNWFAYCARVAPDRLPYQAALLQLALRNGCDVRMVRAGRMQSLLDPGDLSSIVLTDVPGASDAAYVQTTAGETWLDKPFDVVRRQAAHLALAAASLPYDEMVIQIDQVAEGRLPTL